MFSDIILITYVWFLSLMLQLVSAPILALRTKNILIDAGWGVSRIISWICISLIIWILAHLKLPVNATWFVYLGIAALLSGSFWYAWKNKASLLDLFRQRQSLIITEELLFLFGLFGLSLIRGHSPAILDLEKFMDAGFMASYLRSPTLPAPDMWLSGKTINYYSFGHFMGSIMTRFWNLPLSYSYNLLLGFICGLGLSMSFSVVVNFVSGTTKKVTSYTPLIIAGILGAVLVNIAGNTHTAWFKLAKGSWQGYWYADATRFIENTIHEFPSYSFVVSDIHGHVWDFPVVLGFLILFRMWLPSVLHPAKNSRLILLASSLGVFLGVMTMTSMWDLMIYGLLLITAGLILLLYRPSLFKRLLLSAAIAFVSLALTVTPFFLHFESISEGVALVTERSPLWQLFALWTGHWVFSSLALGIAILALIHRPQTFMKKIFFQKNHHAHLLGVIAMVLLGWLLILLPEIFYVKDIYTGHPRANTMFKLTYQGFILMSLTGAWSLGYIWLYSRYSRFKRLLITALIALVVIAVIPFPYFSYRDYYGALNTYKGLDGWQWLEEQYPDDYNAILWINQNISGQPVMLEAWGESYTTFNRVSAYTGLPTVIGWRVHEWLWREALTLPENVQVM
jgi:uncharacterized membrane protein